MTTTAAVLLGVLLFLAGFAVDLGISAGADGYRDLPREKTEEVHP